MEKLNVLVMGLLLPMLAVAQTVKSPNGNVSVTFSLTEKGQPCDGNQVLDAKEQSLVAAHYSQSAILRMIKHISISFHINISY